MILPSTDLYPPMILTAGCRYHDLDTVVRSVRRVSRLQCSVMISSSPSAYILLFSSEVRSLGHRTDVRGLARSSRCGPRPGCCVTRCVSFRSKAWNENDFLPFERTIMLSNPLRRPSIAALLDGGIIAP